MTSPDAARPAPVSVTRSEEQLRVAVARVPVERVRLIRRIVTETRQVEVQVRREELHIERTPLDPTAAPGEPADVVDRAAGLVMVLSEEVPVVTVAVRPVERVVVSVHDVAGERTVTADLRSERVEVTGTAPAHTG